MRTDLLLLLLLLDGGGGPEGLHGHGVLGVLGEGVVGHGGAAEAVGGHVVVVAEGGGVGGGEGVARVEGVGIGLALLALLNLDLLLVLNQLQKGVVGHGVAGVGDGGADHGDVVGSVGRGGVRGEGGSSVGVGSVVGVRGNIGIAGVEGVRVGLTLLALLNLDLLLLLSLVHGGVHLEGVVHGGANHGVVVGSEGRSSVGAEGGSSVGPGSIVGVRRHEGVARVEGVRVGLSLTLEDTLLDGGVVESLLGKTGEASETSEAGGVGVDHLAAGVQSGVAGRVAGVGEARVEGLARGNSHEGQESNLRLNEE